MDIVDQIKEIINKVIEEDFIISIPIVFREGAKDGRKEIQTESGGNQDGQGKTSL